jgi:hypothetical protein
MDFLVEIRLLRQRGNPPLDRIASDLKAANNPFSILRFRKFGGQKMDNPFPLRHLRAEITHHFWILVRV